MKQKKGDLLATLDDSELKTKLASSQADKASYLKQADIAHRDNKLAEAQMYQAQADKSQAEMDELQLKIDESRLTAKNDGTIFTGDLKQRVGAPLKTGDVLFEIGQREKLRAELSMAEEEDVARIQKGQRGQFAASAFPQYKIPFTVTRIDPVAQVVNQKVYFQNRE